MTQPRAADNRHTTRFPLRVSAEVNYGGRLFTALTRDLSVGGVCLESDRLVPEGNALNLGLFLVVDEVEDASAAPLQMRGKVAWATPGEGGKLGSMGIRFEGVTSNQMAGLTRFLKLVPQGQ